MLDRYQLSPSTVMGEQLSPTGTSRSLRSISNRDATSEAVKLDESTTLLQHWSELGGVTGGGFLEGEVGGFTGGLGGVILKKSSVFSMRISDRLYPRQARQTGCS
jgi:hypothetical protein